jgi:DNA (cytosine-5)-methyltransferase 1
MLDGMLPRAFVIENVKGLRSQGNVEKKINDFITVVNERNRTDYKFSMVCLNAAHYGVAQRRERTFIVGFRDGQQFSEPEPTHVDQPSLVSKGRDLFRTSWDAIGDLSRSLPDHDELRVQGKWGQLLPSIPEGLNYLHHTPRGGGAPLFGWRTRYWSFLLKLAKDQPSWTLQAEPGPATGPFHWENRQLSVRELCRLQTIPDTYRICGSYRSARRQIGNAVPPALAEAVGRQVRHHLDGTTYMGTASLATKLRPGCPRPDPTSEVPDRFHVLIGDHEDHPGQGLGPRAAVRHRSTAKLAAE